MARAVSIAPAQNERNVILLTGVVHTATHYAELMYPTLAVALARDTGLALDEVLAWSFPGYLLFGLGALPAGYVADRFGARRLLVAALGAMGIATALAGFSTPGAALVVCLALLGCAGSIYHPAGMGLISHTMSARGRALGINGIFGSLGIALTPVVTAALATHFGWRGAFWLSGATLLGLAVAFGRLPIDERPRAAPTAPPTPDDPARAERPRTLSFALLCMAAMLAGISYRGNTLIQPAYFAERVSMLGYGAATSLAFMAGVVGQYAGGAVADRFDLRRGYLLFHLASIPALLLIARLSELPLLAVAGGFTFFSLGMQPIENSLFAALTPARWRSTGYGVKFVLTFGVGSLAVWLVAWVESAFGLSAVFLALAGIVTLLVATIALFGMVTPRIGAARGSPAPVGDLAVAPARGEAGEPGIT